MFFGYIYTSKNSDEEYWNLGMQKVKRINYHNWFQGTK